MTRILIIQITLFIIFIVPNWLITILYPVFVVNSMQRSAERMVIEMLTNNFFMILYDEGFADTFNSFLLVSPSFRRNLKLLLRFRHGINQIAPLLPTIQR